MRIFRAKRGMRPSQSIKSALSRRATLMLVAGGAAGTVSPAVWARAALSNKNEAVRKSTAAASPGRESENQKIGSASPSDLTELGPQWQVVAVRHGQGTYSVTTADGRKVDFREADLRFKIDSSTAGPAKGKPVILPTGMMGDRASVILASPAEIGALINRHG